MSNAIEIRGLTKNYPRFQLGPLDLTVPRGAIYGLNGPNGAGKTTNRRLPSLGWGSVIGNAVDYDCGLICGGCCKSAERRLRE